MSQTLSEIEIDDQVLIGEKSFIQCISLSVDPSRNEKVVLIED